MYNVLLFIKTMTFQERWRSVSLVGVLSWCYKQLSTQVRARCMKFHIVLNLFHKYYHLQGINGLLVSKWCNACQALVKKY